MLAFALLLSPAASAVPEGEPLHDLVDAAAERLQTADPVAAIKWLTGGAITDKARVEAVLSAVAADADAAGVPADYVTTVFTDQINATEAIQYSRFAAWKFDSSAAPVDAPDLTSSRQRIDELNRVMVDQIADQWAVLNSPDCLTRVQSAKADVVAGRHLDPLFEQALDVATRHYCGT